VGAGGLNPTGSYVGRTPSRRGGGSQVPVVRPTEWGCSKNGGLKGKRVRGLPFRSEIEDSKLISPKQGGKLDLDLD